MAASWNDQLRPRVAVPVKRDGPQRFRACRGHESLERRERSAPRCCRADAPVPTKNHGVHPRFLRLLGKRHSGLFVSGESRAAGDARRSRPGVGGCTEAASLACPLGSDIQGHCQRVGYVFVCDGERQGRASLAPLVRAILVPHHSIQRAQTLFGHRRLPRASSRIPLDEHTHGAQPPCSPARILGPSMWLPSVRTRVRTRRPSRRPRRVWLPGPSRSTRASSSACTRRGPCRRRAATAPGAAACSSSRCSCLLSTPRSPSASTPAAPCRRCGESNGLVHHEGCGRPGRSRVLRSTGVKRAPPDPCRLARTALAAASRWTMTWTCPSKPAKVAASKALRTPGRARHA